MAIGRSIGIGENIKRNRKEKELTQRELAEKSGMSEISIRKYEAEQRTPKIDTIIAIANALEIRSDILLDSKYYTEHIQNVREYYFPEEQHAPMNWEDRNNLATMEYRHVIPFIEYLNFIGYEIRIADNGKYDFILLIKDTREEFARGYNCFT
ncbi:helix-turn-helix transcriptional regulator [Lachnospiraceae bacterium ZAX-1]